MRRRTVLALGMTGLVAALQTSGLPSVGSASPPASGLMDDLAAGQVDGLTVGASGQLRLAVTADAPGSEWPFTLAGSLISPRYGLAMPATTLMVSWSGQQPAGSQIRLEVRGWSEDEQVTPWELVGSGPVVLAWPAIAAQYRLTLLSTEPAIEPVVERVDLQLAPFQAPPPPPPTVGTYRLYATRIGLVGNRTSNGHIVAPNDFFLALPSRRVLASNGGTEYQARVEYKGKSLVLPIWDTGPWNVRDNYWDPTVRRDMWNDLPSGQPQAVAAYSDLYNGGRDGFGRRVLSPAAIDIADGAFAELGMVQSDYVTATMLWIRPSR